MLGSFRYGAADSARANETQLADRFAVVSIAERRVSAARVSALGVSAGGAVTHRGVLAELAQGGEGLLVRAADLLDDELQLGAQLVALRRLRFGSLFLLLVPVVADGCRGRERARDRYIIRTFITFICLTQTVFHNNLLTAALSCGFI